MLVIKAHPWQKPHREKEYMWVKSNGSDAEPWQQKPAMSQEETATFYFTYFSLSYLEVWKIESKKIGSLPPSF